MGYSGRLVALIAFVDQHTNVVADHFPTGAALERHVSIGAWGVSCPLSIPQSLASRAARLPRWEGETAALHCVHQNTGSFHEFRCGEVTTSHELHSFCSEQSEHVPYGAGPPSRWPPPKIRSLLAGASCVPGWPFCDQRRSRSFGFWKAP